MGKLESGNICLHTVCIFLSSFPFYLREVLTDTTAVQAYIEEWAPTLVESSLSTSMLGQMSSCRVYSGGETQERTSQ